MVNLNTKPILKNSYNIEKIQPSYSVFFIKTDNKILPISVDKAGADILRMCNGKNGVTDIIHTLVEQYNENLIEVKKYVNKFLEDMNNNNVIDFNRSYDQIDNIQYGSRDYWTPNKISVQITDAYPEGLHLHADNADATKKAKYLSDDVFYNILFDMKNMDIENMQITGGEPLLHNNFFNFLNKTIELGITCHVLTSGYLYNENTVDAFSRISDKKKIILEVSIFGSEQYHDNYIGVNGAYKKSMSFIDSMIDLGISVNVSCVIDNQKYSEIKDLTKTLKRKGVSDLQICPAFEKKEIPNNCRHINEIVFKLKKEFEDGHFTINKNDADAVAEDGFGVTNCGIGQTQLRIDPCGKVYPCMKSNTVIGNVCEETIKSIQMRNSAMFEKVTSPKIDCITCSNPMYSEPAIHNLVIDKNPENNYKWYEDHFKLLNIIRNINGLKVCAK